MTHEHYHGPGEHGGPEQDTTLPDATSIPEFGNPEDSFAPPLEHDLDDDNEQGHSRPVRDGGDEWGGRW